MIHILTAGGPFVWPILLLTAVAVLFAVRYQRSAARHHATVALGSAACAAIVSLLSFATGFQHAVAPLRAGNDKAQQLLFLGISEALNGPILALTGCFLVGVLLTIGSFRGEQQQRAVALGSQIDESAGLSR